MTGGAFYKLRPMMIQQVGCLAASLLAFLEHKIDFHNRSHTGAWYHSQTRIAAELGMTPWQVRQSLKILVESGLLKITKKAGPNRTDGFECVRGTRGVHTPVCDIHTPIKLDKTNKKESMQACKEMPACRSYEKNPTTSKPPANPSQREVVVILESAGLDGASVRSLARVCGEKQVRPAELRWMIGDLESRRRHPVKSLGALLRTRIADDDFLQVREQIADRERQQQAAQHRQATEWIRDRKVMLQQRIVSLMGTGHYDELQLELMRMKSTVDGYAMRLDGEMTVIPYNTAFMSHASRAMDQLERRIVEAEESKFARSQAKSASSSHPQRPARM